MTFSYNISLKMTEILEKFSSYKYIENGHISLISLKINFFEEL